MGEDAAGRPELVAPVLPRRGLEELLRGWSSDGQLFDALSAVGSIDVDVEWSSRDVERRASRVLLERLEPELAQLPQDAATWREHLPVTTVSNREVSGRPLHPTNWAMTARRYGWPPQAFVSHPRSRVQDESALRALAWTARSLERIVRDVRPVAPLLVGRVDAPVVAMLDVTEQDLGGVEVMRPDRLDLRSLAGSGRPWSGLAPVADAVVRAETDLEFLAFELIEPDPELEWRLFHLSVMGEVLTSLRTLGGRVRWRAPLSASGSSGPQFQITVGQEHWDLWFEAAGAARYYGGVSPYREATSGVARNQRSIGADIMLSLPGKRLLMFECKWSPLATYVGRDGYHQAVSYAVEARSGLAQDAWSFVIGPEEVVTQRSEFDLGWPDATAVVGACSINDVSDLVRGVVQAPDADSGAM
ncbi:hypothetical protein [Nocardioides sp.]|uniref:hypothetical protein n=1 Tax=Nocardioides sp. TaxID=35761 RepID=UPI002BF45347|nr:hypothetical protein [Nocardioides sp.]HSX65923.1 hypothetical protein [Nocardioides sp.]